MTSAPQRYPPPGRVPRLTPGQNCPYLYLRAGCLDGSHSPSAFLPSIQLPRFAGSIRPDHSNFQDPVLIRTPFCAILVGQYRAYGAGYLPSGLTSGPGTGTSGVPGVQAGPNSSSGP